MGIGKLLGWGREARGSSVCSASRNHQPPESGQRHKGISASIDRPAAFFSTTDATPHHPLSQETAAAMLLWGHSLAGACDCAIGRCCGIGHIRRRATAEARSGLTSQALSVRTPQPAGDAPWRDKRPVAEQAASATYPTQTGGKAASRREPLGRVHINIGAPMRPPSRDGSARYTV